MNIRQAIKSYQYSAGHVHSFNGLAFTAIVALFLLGAGCATTSNVDGSVALQALESPAWSYESGEDRFTVAVSPARQTLQFGGTTGLLIGGGISMVSNARQRGPIDEVLEGYDPEAYLESTLESALTNAWQHPAPKVDPMRSTTGYEDRREAQRNYFRELARQDIDGLLNISPSYGLFGAEGVLAVRLDTAIQEPPTGRTRWNRHFLATSEAPLLGERLTDPTQRMTGNWRSPRLTVKEHAITQWTQDEGARLKSNYEQLVDGVVAAMLSDLGLEVSPTGLYYLGMQALYDNEAAEAYTLFEEALAQVSPEEPLWVKLYNGQACALWEDEQPEAALAYLEKASAAFPEDATTQYNQAYALAETQESLDVAAQQYRAALEQGMPRSKDIERSLENAGIAL